MSEVRPSIVEHREWLVLPQGARCRVAFYVGIALLLSVLAGCSKKAPVAEDSNNLDRVNSREVPPPKRFLHKTFSVKEYQGFSFEVPPHIVRANIHGTFQSSVKNGAAEPVSDESTAVELLLMSAEQFDDFTHRRSATSTFAVEPSFSQDVDIDLAPTRADAVKYYLVFRNSPGGPTRSVNADFTLTFQ